MNGLAEHGHIHGTQKSCTAGLYVRGILRDILTKLTFCFTYVNNAFLELLKGMPFEEANVENRPVGRRNGALGAAMNSKQRVGNGMCAHVQ
ncbi:unnamed protein product [Gongylonema pulchrum]|uniref:Reverse transcriptase domain-containing protein n=1 Tax=Gongylonema pulchrum TaxID=637853 RepID=A0A183DFC0_9BILA|nr:unnamed protein product [Gongylonema pulchrum]